MVNNIENPKTKICCTCKEKYPRTHEYFYRHKNSNSNDGLDYRCKKCSKTIDKQRYKEKNGYIKMRKSLLKNKYNMTNEEYDKLFAKQNGKCMICGKREKYKKEKLTIDHNHKTNIFRGLICHKCNRGLGYFNDNGLILIKAVKYLRGELL